MNYARTALSDVLTVDSIVTVYHINLANTSRRGEAHDFPEAFYCEEGCYSLLIDGKRAERKGVTLSGFLLHGAKSLGTGQGAPESEF